MAEVRKSVQKEQAAGLCLFLALLRESILGT